MRIVRSAIIAATIAIVSLGFAPSANAHHSGAGFSADVVKEITGVIKEFQFRNPHSWIQVNVADANGKVTEWSVEWGSPNQLGREGIRPSTFTPGSTVTIKLHPMTNGSPMGGFIGAKFKDGKTLGKWDNPNAD
ncbi:MAG: DUF6152 family protein [Bryobacteraceae bacterium]